MESVNRRNYFRIDDQLGLSYQLLDPEEYQQHQQEHRQRRLKDHQQREVEQRTHSAIRNVQIKYPDLGDILTLLNKKIDQLAHNMGAPDQSESDDIEPSPVNISASGIAFFQDNSLGNNTLLEMVLTLYPELEKIRLFGYVVDCTKQKISAIEHYKVSVEFEYLVEEDRDELIQYIMKQQNISLRKNSGIDDDFE